jgi:hypothetical protein
MRILIYPADEYGCGKIRLSWPGQALAAAGHDVIVEKPEDRRLRMHVADGKTLTHVEIPDGTDVVVLQRPTHDLLAQVPAVLATQGVATVVDVDDDLSSIHRENPAWIMCHPQRHREELAAAGWKQPRLKMMTANLNATRPYHHSWLNLEQACRDATLVTMSTPRLLRHYAAHGRGRVLHNYLADHYYGHDRADSPNIGWPASIHSHPNDPAVLGNALQRVLRETGVTFTVFGETTLDLPGPPTGRITTVGKRFGLDREPASGGIIDIDDWPAALAKLGIAVCPLADTTFNQSKSWLKPLELCAVGVPWVASPRAEYRRLLDLAAADTAPGLLADKTADWYRTLRLLIRDDTARAEISHAGRELAASMRLTDHAWKYLEAWNDAGENARQPLRTVGQSANA